MPTTEALNEIIAKQKIEIARLRKKLSLQRAGHQELSRTVDAICIAVAKKYGSPVIDGVWEAVLPDVSVESLTGEYYLRTERLANKRYTIRAVRKNVPEN